MKDMIDKRLILIAVVTFLVAGLMGFYGGRYYERNIFRKRFTTQMRNGQQGQGFRIRGTNPSGNPQNGINNGTAPTSTNSVTQPK